MKIWVGIENYWLHYEKRPDGLWNHYVSTEWQVGDGSGEIRLIGVVDEDGREVADVSKQEEVTK